MIHCTFGVPVNFLGSHPLLRHTKMELSEWEKSIRFQCPLAIKWGSHRDFGHKVDESILKTIQARSPAEQVPADFGGEIFLSVGGKTV